MSDVNRVNGFLRALPVDFVAPNSTRRFGARGGTVLADPPADDVVVSDLGAALSRLSETPGVRVGKIAKLRAAIAAGRYESAHKMDAVVDKLLDELTR